MRLGITSDLLGCMDSDLHETNSVHVADARIVDGASVELFREMNIVPRTSELWC